MYRSLRPLIYATILACGFTARFAQAAAEAAPAEGATQAEAEMPPEVRAYYEALDNLAWVKGPTAVDLAGNSRLTVPDGYVFLDQSNTDKYLELNQNLTSGNEVMIAPASFDWVAYLSFADEGYVKDDEQIDAPALLKALQAGAKEGNKERRRRGWSELHVIDWAVPPAYNASNKRLEWATLLEADDGRSANFSTKVLGRRGHTSVIMVSAPEDLASARPGLEAVLGGYSFVGGERYADFVPGDKVAEYGLAALVLGGAAAIATKKGFWAVLVAFVVTKAKLLFGVGIAMAVGLRRFVFGKKASDAN
ncbi:MAG TPA: DUF2167 domain-containing protein [Steroidobacteraceae bacterium]|nr:DUF2167 domain-containing protein [Steroidobacteraceae bacterium]